MNKAAAKRRACIIAEAAVQRALDDGEAYSDVGGAEDDGDANRIEDGLQAIIYELHRRGAGRYGSESDSDPQGQR